jgi:hypothetical protein
MLKPRREAADCGKEPREVQGPQAAGNLSATSLTKVTSRVYSVAMQGWSRYPDL